MNSVIRYDEDQAKAVEAAIMAVFGCRLTDIVCVSDTPFKKVLVYILYARLGFCKRNIGHAYHITWLFVPTVTDRVEMDIIRDKAFRDKVNCILKIVEGSHAV